MAKVQKTRKSACSSALKCCNREYAFNSRATANNFTASADLQTVLVQRTSAAADL